MAQHSQNQNLLWGGTVISAVEHNSELIGNLDKFSSRRDYQRLDRANDTVFQGELSISRILPVEPFRDLLNRPIGATTYRSAESSWHGQQGPHSVTAIPPPD